MKSVVTGGCGFIGSHLTERLVEEGHQVVVIDNLSCGRKENLEPAQGKGAVTLKELDVADGPEPLVEACRGADYIFHLAGLADIVPSIENPLPYFRANVTGTLHLLQAALSCRPQKFVYAASSSCYGIPDVYPTPEDAPIQPRYPYALTKRLGEELVMHWGEVYDLPVLSTRFFNVYGPRSRTSGSYGAVLGVFLAQKLAGEPFTIVGDGTQTRDFTYVSDVADAMWVLAQSERTDEIYNIGTGRDVSVNHLAELLGGAQVFVPKRPGEPDQTLADISKLQAHTGWQPQVSFEQGIEKVLRRLEDWRDAPVWTPDDIAEATRTWMERLGDKD